VPYVGRLTGGVEHLVRVTVSSGSRETCSVRDTCTTGTVIGHLGAWPGIGHTPRGFPARGAGHPRGWGYLLPQGVFRRLTIHPRRDRRDCVVEACQFELVGVGELQLGDGVEHVGAVGEPVPLVDQRGEVVK
jgi:hypothetical protein